MRCLVTGGAGYIGTLLCRELIDRGHEVRVLDSFMFGKEPLVSALAARPVEIVDADIRDFAAVRSALGDVDAVIHLAALANDACADVDPRIARTVNYEATEHLVDCAIATGAHRFLYASSASVYGSYPGNAPEDAPLNPKSLYAQLKAEAEAYVLAASAGSLASTSIRAGTVYGLSPRMRLDLVVNSLTAAAAVHGRIVVRGGRQIRPNIHVNDLVRAYADLAESDPHLVAGQVYNIASENYSVMELAELVTSVIKRPTTVVVDDAVDQRSYGLSTAKFQAHIGRLMTTSVSDGAAEIECAISTGQIGDVGNAIYHNLEWLSARR